MFPGTSILNLSRHCHPRHVLNNGSPCRAYNNSSRCDTPHSPIVTDTLEEVPCRAAQDHSGSPTLIRLKKRFVGGKLNMRDCGPETQTYGESQIQNKHRQVSPPMLGMGDISRCVAPPGTAIYSGRVSWANVVPRGASTRSAIQKMYEEENLSYRKHATRVLCERQLYCIAINIFGSFNSLYTPQDASRLEHHTNLPRGGVKCSAVLRHAKGRSKANRSALCQTQQNLQVVLPPQPCPAVPRNTPPNISQK